jgi:hypothetical protein
VRNARFGVGEGVPLRERLFEDKLLSESDSDPDPLEREWLLLLFE